MNNENNNAFDKESDFKSSFVFSMDGYGKKWLFTLDFHLRHNESLWTRRNTDKRTNTTSTGYLLKIRKRRPSRCWIDSSLN